MGGGFAKGVPNLAKRLRSIPGTAQFAETSKSAHGTVAGLMNRAIRKRRKFPFAESAANGSRKNYKSCVHELPFRVTEADCGEARSVRQDAHTYSA